VTRTTDLIEQLRRLGAKLDDARDPETMRFLLRARRALHAALEEARATRPVNPDKAFQGAIARGEISGDVILDDEEGNPVKRTVYIGRHRTEQV
jgi:hypothetical protein